MISENSPQKPKIGTPAKGTVGTLFLNGREVGEVVVQGWDSSWTHARFTPGPGFSDFAAIYGRWSLFMHEDEHAPLHESASAALADSEREMDSIHAKVFFEAEHLWHEIRQLNIDGELAEWKEF